MLQQLQILWHASWQRAQSQSDQFLEVCVVGFLFLNSNVSIKTSKPKKTVRKFLTNKRTVTGRARSHFLNSLQDEVLHQSQQDYHENAQSD
jgi:hypothetical protein